MADEQNGSTFFADLFHFTHAFFLKPGIADSKHFVRAVMDMLRARKLRVGNADVTVLAERPKLSPVRDEIRRQVAQLLEVGLEQVNVKATTTEKLGFLGRAEGIAAHAVVLLIDVE